jgi:hypothetical protein
VREIKGLRVRVRGLLRIVGVRASDGSGKAWVSATPRLLGAAVRKPLKVLEGVVRPAPVPEGRDLGENCQLASLWYLCWGSRRWGRK